MKRTVKAWALACRNKDRIYSVRLSAKLGYRLTEPWFEVPCTITYDDGKKPRKKAAKR